ncbi:hypothetical protein Dimus_010304 [Dionaea muscipula]
MYATKWTAWGEIPLPARVLHSHCPHELGAPLPAHMLLAASRCRWPRNLGGRVKEMLPAGVAGRTEGAAARPRSPPLAGRHRAPLFVRKSLLARWSAARRVPPLAGCREMEPLLVDAPLLGDAPLAANGDARRATAR